MSDATPRGAMNESSGLSSTSGTCTCAESTGWNGVYHKFGCPYFRVFSYPTNIVPKPDYGGKCCPHIKEHHKGTPVEYKGNGVVVTTGSRCSWRGCGCPEWVE